MSAIAGVLLTAALTPVVAVSGAAASSAISVFESLPDHIDPGQLSQPTKVYAKNSEGERELLAQFYAQNRVMVGWDGISQYAKDAVVSEEDPRFYSHGGVDVLAAARATVGNALGARTSGASTVTMQYVRNVLVQESEMIVDEEEREKAFEDATRQDIDRKLKEMKLAISVEKQFSKDEILLGYFNIANFGGQVYGIEAAAKRYFDTSAAELTLPQAASLVATVNAPSILRIDIPENLEANKERRDLILRSMLREGKITEDQYTAAVETPVEPKLTETATGCRMADRLESGLGHFCNYVTLQILNDTKFGETQEERWFRFLNGGYVIDTTIDLDMQKAAHDSITGRIPALMDGIDIGSTVVSVEVGTGRVLAMAQNRPFADNPEFLAAHPDYTSINYATDYEYGGSTGFQVGSTFKAFTLAEWIRSGRSVNEIVNANARTVNYSDFAAECLGGVYGHGPWTFKNDSNMATGRQTVERVTSWSVNGGFVSMAQQLDLCNIMKLAQDMGVHRASELTGEHNADKINYKTRNLTVVPSNSFGGIDEIAPISMATAYAGFAGGGKVCTPIPIDRITGPDGQEVPFTPSDCKQAIDPAVAAGTAYVLNRGVASGYANYMQSWSGVPHLGKTGTTDDRVDDWSLGASSKVATAVWLGNVTGKQNLSYFGMYRAAKPVWSETMAVADEKYGGDPFPEPDRSALMQKTQTVPDVKGKTVDEARTLLEQVGFDVTVGDEVDSDVAAGRVAGTNPGGGTDAPQNSLVTLQVSNGKKKDEKSIPGGLTGISAREAASKLNNAGFREVYMQCRTNADPKENLSVVKVDPASGSEARTDTRVTLTLDC